MTRPVASIIVHARDGWELTRTCLEALRPRMGPRDEVIVVDDATADETAKGLERYSWARVIRTDDQLGDEGAWDLGLGRATGDVVLFVPSDALFPTRALDDLLGIFDDGDVVAAGPRLDTGAGNQAARLDAPVGDLGGMRRLATRWRDEHRGTVTEVSSLELSCLAARRAVLDAAGGVGDGSTLSARLAEAGGRLVVADEVLVFLRGGSRGPLVSLCMIVKDEEENLPGCLETVEGFVDEIVVYDTGSQDQTVDMARAAGATVIEGHWDDDFGRARNAALEHCRGQWILWLDADEALEGDLGALREHLASEPSVDALDVPIDNVIGGAVQLSHKARRLFKRSRAHWVGRLHEQVVNRPGQADLAATGAEGVRILHYGYEGAAVAGRNKRDRNVRIALAALEAGEGDRVLLLLNAARSLNMAGRTADAAECFAEARALGTGSVAVQRQVLRQGAQALLQLGRVQEALEWLADLRSRSTVTGMVDYLEGIALATLGEHDRALELLERVEAIEDDDGYRLASYVVEFRRGLLAYRAEQWAAAADDLLAVASAPQSGQPAWALAVEACAKAGLDLGTAAGAVDEDELLPVVGQVLNASPESADAFGEALWARFGDDKRLLAFAIRLGPRLTVERALDWAARVRAAGLEDSCPLATLAADGDRPALDRVRASAALVGAFGDDRGHRTLTQAARALEIDEIVQAIVDVDTLQPALLPQFIEDAATDGRRSIAIARVLAEFGAPDEGVAVLLHGLDRGADDGLRAEAATWLDEIGRSETAALVLGAR